MTPKVPSVKWKTDTLDFIRILKNCAVRDSLKKTKRQATGWEGKFASHISDKALASKIYNHLSKLCRKSPTIHLETYEAAFHQRGYLGGKKKKITWEGV